MSTNVYLVKFITDYAVILTNSYASDEEEAERFALQTLGQELGITLSRYDLEIELEGVLS